ncbi:replisome organizer [Lactococcus lactis RTB018]|nr:phage replisome organizer N-terminal domain-containing protein [Lactococcus lactis]OAZ15904.1 replisome organizer [Lactococcus lactis RTB018]
MATKSKTKIYFWIKLDENFFKNLAIKNLRKTVTGGDTLVIIYQQMLLSSLANNGVIYYEGTLQDIAQEIALNLDEKLDDVRLAIDYFQKAGLLQIGDDGSAEMLQVPMLIGQETNWNKYKREKKLENFQPASNQLPNSSNQAPTEIESESDIDIEKEINKDDDVGKNSLQSLSDFFSNNFHPISQRELEQLREFVNDSSYEMVLLALEIAVDNNARTIKYVRSIMDKWENNNIKTPENYHAFEAERKRKFASNNQNKFQQQKPVKKAPEWTDEGRLIKAGVDTTGMTQNEMYKLVGEMGLRNE